MRRGVDEIRERDQGGGQPDGGAVERGDEDLGVRVEGVGYVEVVGYEVLQPRLSRVDIGRGGARGAEGYVCAAGEGG